MCGVLGMFGNISVGREQFQKALEQIRHRGPDGEGFYTDPENICYLGHRRLSILDLSENGRQPMATDSHVLVYNGEVYNHLELRQRDLPRTTFKSTSDSETVLHLISQYDASELRRANGMYAGALFDKTRKTLTLFRDPLGIKPLYYTIQNHCLYFSSEIKALRKLLPELRTIHREALASYLTFENYPQSESLFAGVKSLLPGEIITVQRQGSHLQLEYSAIESSWHSPEMDGSDPVERGRRVLEKAVQDHLLSDVDVGVYLSGGLDSTLVASIAGKHGQRIEGFTGYFSTNDRYYDESDLAELVAKKWQIQFNRVEIKPSDFANHFDDLVWTLDEPRMGMGSFSQYVVAKTAAQSRKVILAGHGGDEIFGGYPTFKAFWLRENLFSRDGLKCLKSFTSKEMIWLFYLYFETWLKGKTPFAPKLSTLAKRLNQNWPEGFTGPSRRSNLEDLMTYYRRLYIPGLLLVEDHISMRHSLETRVPLWSLPVLNWAKTIPLDVKLKGGQLKALLKEIAAPYLPPELLTAPKRGFPTPLRLWFREELVPFVKDRLMTAHPVLDELVPVKVRTQLIKSHIQSPQPFAWDERRAHQIWMLLCLESWIRQFDMADIR